MKIQNLKWIYLEIYLIFNLNNMQKCLDILEEMMEERTPYKEHMPLHKTLWYEVCHWWYIALREARSRIQALENVELSKEVYDTISEKAWKYDNLCK